jgi:enoyl-CoA hydratase/carnithine racemase
MAAYETVLYETDPERKLARVVINRPEKRNSLTWQTMSELTDAFRRADDDDAVRVVVLTGAGDKAFSTGADLGGFPEGGAYEVYRGQEPLVELLETMRGMGKLIIARVQGYALAGGLGLVAASDVAICAESATLGTPEMNVGVFPMMISAAVLRNVTKKRAMEMLFTGKRYSGKEAAEMGLVTRAVPDDRLDDEVEEIVSSLAAKSPTITRIGKESLELVQDLSFGEALRVLQNRLTLVMSTEDAREGLAAFAEKRQPEWKGK